MKKLIPYVYIGIGIIILIETFFQFFQDKDLYRILFNWNTESKYVYLLVKLLIAALILYGGLRRLKTK